MTYAPPAILTTVKAMTDSDTIAPMPSATAVIGTNPPSSLPATLSSPPRRPSDSDRPTTNSTLGPGITINRNDATANVSADSMESME